MQCCLNPSLMIMHILATALNPSTCSLKKYINSIVQWLVHLHTSPQACNQTSRRYYRVWIDFPGLKANHTFKHARGCWHWVGRQYKYQMLYKRIHFHRQIHSHFLALQTPIYRRSAIYWIWLYRAFSLRSRGIIATNIDLENGKSVILDARYIVQTDPNWSW